MWKLGDTYSVHSCGGKCWQFGVESAECWPVGICTLLGSSGDVLLEGWTELLIFAENRGHSVGVIFLVL